MSDDVPFSLPPVDPETTSEIPAGSLSPELLAGLLADGDDELAAWTLRHALDETSRADVYDGLLREAMSLVGERWSNGQWSIAEEHLASRTLLRTLDRLRPGMGPDARIGPVAVLAGVEGEQHMIGLVCLEHLLLEDGWAVANLGADLPAADLGRFVDRNDVALVALTAMDGRRVGAVADAVRTVHEVTGEPRVPVLVGGGIASIPGLAATVEADGVAHSLAEALALAAVHRPS